MPDVCKELPELLETVQRPGDFFASGRLQLLSPRLVVDGVGQIALPLLPSQAGQLIAAAERAPYGRGADTIVDADVRRTWQIAPERVHIGGRHWQQTLEAAVKLAAAGLGVDGPVSAALYKLLVYDEGSFFVSHRDTEKQPGMFATLVLALPATSTGGELVVRHREREVTLDLANDDPSELMLAAFYADCVHEVRPVTAGCRATLVYNLIRTGAGDSPVPPDYREETAHVTALLHEWAGGKTAPDDGVPEKLVYPLEHAYSPAELDFGTLKGADAAVAAVLRSAASRAGCELHLALVAIEESGCAEHGGRFEDDLVAGEVIARSEVLNDWRSGDGEPVPFTELPILEGESSPPGVLDDLDPDEEHFREATGNEGASFERTYRHAAMVLWPRRRRLAVLNQAGVGVTVPYLQALAARWLAEGAQPGSAPWCDAHALAGHMLDTWPRGRWRGRADDDGPDETADALRSPLSRLLANLTTLTDAARIEAAIALVTAERGHDRADNAAILAAVAVLPPEQAAAMIEALVASHATDALGASCRLLRAAIAGPFVAAPGRLGAAAAALIAALPGDPALAPLDRWGEPRHLTPGAAAVADLVTVAESLDAGLAARLASHLLAWPATYGIDRVLVPAVKRRLDGGASATGAAMSALIAACLAHLGGRAAEPLDAPRNWTRVADIACSCQHCAELRRFLASPTTETWTLKARVEVRHHVETTITSARADVDVTTLERSRPYSLVCRKNSASYQRRVAQRNQDRADIAVLTTTAAAGGRPASGAGPRSRAATAAAAARPKTAAGRGAASPFAPEAGGAAGPG